MNISERNREIANKWIQAFNDHDLEVLLNLYHQHAEHYSPKLKVRKPETGGYIKGKDQLHEWWQDAFDRLPSLKYHLRNLIIDEQQVLLEYERIVDGETAMMIAEILEIDAELIIRSRVYHG